jgi:hypothetical protein
MRRLKQQRVSQSNGRTRIASRFGQQQSCAAYETTQQPPWSFNPTQVRQASAAPDWHARPGQSHISRSAEQGQPYVPRWGGSVPRLSRSTTYKIGHWRMRETPSPRTLISPTSNKTDPGAGPNNGYPDNRSQADHHLCADGTPNARGRRSSVRRRHLQRPLGRIVETTRPASGPLRPGVTQPRCQSPRHRYPGCRSAGRTSSAIRGGAGRTADGCPSRPATT